ncbi:MAG: delta-60 repeat domain-containing protein, partial [Flavobacteriaceae bacterium]|nr:delta-60 repeat domain-containing protein [Flavobacteriaceae bacterium]
GNVSASVNSIKTDRVNNRVFVGGAFKAFYTDVTLVKKKDGDYTKAVNLLCIEADGKINNANDHAADIFTHPQPNNIVWSIDVQDDGKVLIGGEFTEIDGVSQSNFARLNTNGSLESFNPNPSKIIHAITTGTVDGTEYMFIAGEDGYLVKYSTAATPVADTTFNSAVAALGWEVGDTIWSVELFNGWLVIGGEFEFTQDSVTYTNLIRVNKDTGALDTNFNFTFTASDQDQIHMLPVNEQMGSGSTPITRDGLPRSTDNPSVRTIAGNADGDRLIIGGLFKDANSETSITTKNIFAVLEDGTIDKKFNPKPVLNDSGPDGHIQLAKYRKDLPSSDGNLYIAGSFTHFNSKAYTPEEVEALELRTLFTPTDRSLTNVARLFG